MIIKSITPVRIFGTTLNGCWAARLRLVDGTELFAGVGAGYTLQQAQQLITHANERVGQEYDADFRVNDYLTGLPCDAMFQPLAEGLTVAVR